MNQFIEEDEYEAQKKFLDDIIKDDEEQIKKLYNRNFEKKNLQDETFYERIKERKDKLEQMKKM